MLLPLGDFRWGSGVHSVSDMGFGGDLVTNGLTQVSAVSQSGAFLRIFGDCLLPFAFHVVLVRFLRWILGIDCLILLLRL